MDLVPFFVTFGLVFLAELPDKTAIATLVLSSRHKGQWVFAGVAAAFAVQVTIAVIAGTYLAKLPQRPVELVVSIIFLVSAILLWRESNKQTAAGEEVVEDEFAEQVEARESDGNATSQVASGDPQTASDSQAEGSVADKAEKGFLKVASLAFMIVFVAEFLDLTQIMTANLAIKYQSPIEVWLGAFLALCSVAALAIIGGKALLKVLPLKTITRAASILLFALAAYSIFEVIRG